MKQMRKTETRALPTLIEQRNNLIDEMESLLNSAKAETRALTDKESTRYDEIKAEIGRLDKTAAAEEEARSFEKKTPKAEPEEQTVEQKEERAFGNYIRKSCGLPVEERAGEQNLDMTNNQGAVVPTTIADRIISEVKEISPILEKATIFRANGTLKIPVWGKANTTHDITVAYGADFEELVADSGKFTSVDLTGYLTGALTLVGRTVVNNAQINVVSFVISEMAKKIAIFLEKELLNGTADKATGALSTTTTHKAGSTSAISADNLIELQAKIPTAYQADACWVMNPATFTNLKKAKDAEGRYLLEYDFSSSFPYRILGKPVYLSDNMPVIASAAKAVLYGDFSGLAVNIRENISIQVLQEKYATQHAIGIVSWFEFDSKVMDNQRLATLVMSA